MTSEAKQEVERLLREGQKIRAIQYLNNTYQISLEDSKLLVETLEAEIANRNPHHDPVKHVKQNLNTSLKEALQRVEEVARETNPKYVSYSATGCLRGFAKAIGLFFAFLAIIFLATTGVIFYFQTKSINKSDLVTGKVTGMQNLDGGGSAPVVEYPWKGKIRSYQSNSYSTPPDYSVGQTVSLFVNREDPEDILLNTFSDRYALLVGLGVIGGFLGAIAMLFLYFGSRKF